MVHPALWRPRAPFGTQSPPPGCPRVAHLVHGPCLHRGWWRANTSSPPYKEPSKDFQVWQEETYYMLEPSYPPQLLYIYESAQQRVQVISSYLVLF